MSHSPWIAGAPKLPVSPAGGDVLSGSRGIWGPGPTSELAGLMSAKNRKFWGTPRPVFKLTGTMSSRGHLGGSAP